ncbi:MAG: XdhC family protein [Gammaproteobacteria bacterium]
MKRAHIEALLAAREAKRPAALVTVLEGADAWLVHGDAVEVAAGDLPQDVLAGVAAALRADRASVLEAGGQRYFIQPQNPPLRMLIVGAVHVAQALTPMARLAGYAVTVIDPRRAFATVERFPGIELVHQWPDDAMRSLAPDTRTAVVTLTHDPKFDDPALGAALASAAFYIGALGSRRTHAARCQRLIEQGVSESSLERIHAPIGLNIGARSQAEIAVAVLGEITQRLRAAPAPGAATV